MKSKHSTIRICLAATCLISAPNLAHSATSTLQSSTVAKNPTTTATWTYADIVDLADESSLIAVGRIKSVISLPDNGPNLTNQGFRRVYVESQIDTLIRGDGGISPIVTYLYDAPLDSRGRLPKLKKAQVILFARNGDRPGQIQLVSRNAQLPASPSEIERIRNIATSLVATDAPPKIIGVGDAFYVAGTVQGESETQIFLRTSNGEPVSLSIIRRPGQAPRWAVALGEIVDEAARPPEPGSLLWYRMTCALPASLPQASVRSLPALDAEAARADYQLVLRALGSCERHQIHP